MTSINKSSIQRFISHPGQCHLAVQQGIITEIFGRSPEDDIVHQQALKALEALAMRVPQGSPSWCDCLMPSKNLSNFVIAVKCKKAEFIYKLDQWAKEGVVGENRIEAVKRILKAYESQSKSLDLANLNLTSVPSQILELVYVQDLGLSGNPLVSLPPQITTSKAAEFGSTPFIWSPNPIIAKECKKVAFTHQIAQWAQEEVVGENRKEAARRIIEAYNLQSKCLNLCHLNLRSLPIQIEQMSDLRTLDLSHNYFVELPDEIYQLNQLKELYLQSNQITSLSEKIGKLNYLETLIVSGNKLTKLPDSIRSCYNLSFLDLSFNKLTTLPDTIIYLSSISILDLSNNWFTTLSSNIGYFQKLNTLNLENNRLTSVPKEIQKLNDLRSLNLKNNCLDLFPEQIAELKGLGVLDVSGNCLTTIPKEIANKQHLQFKFDDNPLCLGKTGIQIIASYPFLLCNKHYFLFLKEDKLAQICEINGLALEFVPKEKRTLLVIAKAVKQNPEAEKFLEPLYFL